jgi:hypothetical protein
LGSSGVSGVSREISRLWDTKTNRDSRGCRDVSRHWGRVDVVKVFNGRDSELGIGKLMLGLLIISQLFL